MTILTFTNKQEYLTWRTQWRANYAGLSCDIRDYKANRKDKDPATRRDAQSMCSVFRRRARQMLEERKQSKIQAQQQYAAAKAAMVGS